MSTVLAERLFTGADVAALPTELPSGAVRYELWEGVLYTMPPTGRRHAALESAVATTLATGGHLPGQGQVLAGEVGIYLSHAPDSLVGADVAYLTADQLPPRESAEGFLETIPTLVVEVVSPSEGRPAARRKAAAYLFAGARVVWVIDPAVRTLTVHRPGLATRVWRAGETFADDFPIPGLTFDVAGLFAGTE